MTAGGDLRGILFGLERKLDWKGYGLMGDLNEAEVAVPAAWELAESATEPAYEISLFRTVTARASKPSTRSTAPQLPCLADPTVSVKAVCRFQECAA